MADLRLNITSDSRRAQQDVDSLRREIQTLRTQLGQVQQGSTSAGTAIDEMGDESAQTARQVRSLGDATSRTNRETQNASRGFTSATGGTQNFTRSLGGLGSILGGLGVAVAGSELIDLGRGFVTAASRVEGFRNGLTALYGDAQIANNVLSDLEGLAELPGITFEGAVQGALRLQTVGVEGERANAVIREFGNAAALAGNGSEELGRAMIGLSQSISRGRIDQENLNQILENVPLIGNSIREAFGTIEAQNIQAQLDAAGQSVQDFTDIVTNQLAQGARASADSTANAFSNLGNSVFRLQAEIGNQFLGSVRDATVGLSNFLDTIRRGVTDVSTLPQPIQDIVEGAQALFDALQRVGTTIANTLGPPLAFLGENLGSLLGEVLGLAAALYNSLEPAFQVIHTITGVVITAVGQLVEHLTAVVRGVTEVVNFISFWSDQQDSAAVSTENLTEKVGAATAALGESATASELFGAKLTDLNTELDGVNTEIANYEARLKSAREQAVGETNPSIQQLERRLAAVRARAAELESQIGTTQTALDKQTTSTMAATAATKEAAVEFTTYAEAIRQVQANIEAYVEEQALLTDFGDFWRVASGEAEGYTTAIDLATASVVDHQTELETLTNAGFFDGLDDPIKDYVAALEATSESADRAFGSINQVGEAVGDADFRSAAAELTDFDDAFQLSEATIPRVTSAMREFTGTAPDIEKVERAVEMTTRSVDDLLDSVEALGDGTTALDPLETSFRDLSDDIVPGVTRDIIDAFVGIAEGNEIPDAFSELGENIGTGVVNSLSGYLADTLADTLADNFTDALADQGLTAAISGLGSSLGAGIAIAVSAAVTAIPIIDLINRAINPPEANTPQEIDEFTRRQIFQPGHPLHPDTPDPTQPRTATREGGVRDIIPVSAQLGGGVRGDRRVRDPDLFGNTGFNFFQADSRRRAAQSFAEAAGTDRQAIEDAAILMYGPEDYAAEVAAATGDALSDIPEPDLPPEIADPLGTFSPTRDEREVLAPYETAVREAENAIEDLTADSTPQEIADAYQALVFAQTNLSSITEGIIRTAADAERITGTAATNAIRTLGLDLGDDLRTANNALIGSLGDVGFEVVGGIENIRQAIDVSDISSAFRRIPEQVEEAAAEPEPEPETAPALREVFSFSAGQRRILDPLNAAVSDAEEFIRNFITEDSTPEEIQAAYTALTTAEQALYDQQVEFITNATHITDETRTGALAAAGRDFDGDIRDANQTLVRALGNVGFELVNALTFTSGILMGSAAAIQQIPVEAEAAAEAAEPEADETDPVAILRSNARLAANQVRRSRTALGQATSESDFETRRRGLIQSVNAAYTAQIALLDALGLSEADYQDRFEDAEDARDSALTRATTSVNTFTEARIKGEEDAAEAAQDAADEKIAAEDRAERERMRIADRAARESQRIAERLSDDIADLRDKEVANEADRLQAIEDLNEDSARRREDIEEDHQDRLRDIQLRSLRSREDIDREFSRDIEDILRESGADERLLNPTFLQDFFRTAQSPSATGLGDLASGIGADLSEDDIRRIQGLARERLQDRQDIDTRSERARFDAQSRVEQARAEETARSEVRRQEIQENANATATAIETALQPLLEQQAGLSPETIAQQASTASIESQTAQTASETAQTQATTAQTDSENTETFGAAIDLLDPTIAEFSVGIGRLTDAGEALQAAARVQGLFDAAAALEGAAGELSMAVTEFGAVTRGLGFLIGGFLNTFDTVNTALEAGTLGIAAPRTQEETLPLSEMTGEQMIETSPENPLDVRIANPDDIYNPERIAELRGEGLNNREIGMTLRDEVSAGVAMGVTEAFDTQPARDIDAELAMAAAPAVQTLSAGIVNVSGGTVNVSGPIAGEGGGGGRGEQGTVVNNITINSNTSDPDALAQEVGDVVVKQQQQGRTLLGG